MGGGQLGAETSGTGRWYNAGRCAGHRPERAEDNLHELDLAFFIGLTDAPGVPVFLNVFE